MHRVYSDSTKEVLLLNTKTKMYKNASMTEIGEMLKPNLIVENEYIAAYHVYSESSFKNGVNGYCIWVFNKNNIDDQLVFVSAPEILDNKTVILTNNVISVNNNVYYINADNIWA
jgi:outer membrane protein assembly factor BamB